MDPFSANQGLAKGQRIGASRLGIKQDANDNLKFTLIKIFAFSLRKDRIERIFPLGCVDSYSRHSRCQ